MTEDSSRGTKSAKGAHGAHIGKHVGEHCLDFAQLGGDRRSPPPRPDMSKTPFVTLMSRKVIAFPQRCRTLIGA